MHSTRYSRNRGRYGRKHFMIFSARLRLVFSFGWIYNGIFDDKHAKCSVSKISFYIKLEYGLWLWLKGILYSCPSSATPSVSCLCYYLLRRYVRFYVLVCIMCSDIIRFPKPLTHFLGFILFINVSIVRKNQLSLFSITGSQSKKELVPLETLILLMKWKFISRLK